MKLDSRTIVASALLALASGISAQVASICPATNVCFKLNIPANTASSGSGDVFFQISAPSTYEWVALGQGKGMGGANMFVVYTSSASNVTLSPRTASGHNMPSFNSAAQATLLEGSGVSNGMMTANVKCSNCNSWSGGSMDFKSSSGNWIYAFQPSNGPKNSNDQSASIQEHDGHAAFSWDFASAKGGSSVNPLVNAAPAGSGSGNSGAVAPSCVQRNAPSASGAATGSITSRAATPTQSSNDPDDDDNEDRRSARSRYATGFGSYPTARPSARPPTKRASLPYCDELPNGGGANSGTSNSGFRPIAASGSGGNQGMMLIAHGVLASLAFVILFPAGSIAIRLASFPGVVWLHAAFQVFAYLIYIAAFGIGVYLATTLRLLDSYHAIIGIVVIILIFFQPILGFMHHTLFKKYSRRTMWSYAHIWLGRVAVTLGIINGGLGLKLADNSSSGKIAYGVVAGVMWLAWVAASVVGERRRKTASGSQPRVKSERHGSDGSGSPVVPAAAAAAAAEGHYAPKER